MHNKNWNDYCYFLQVAKSGSLSAAAKILGVNQSTVFRKIDALEARLKVRLFERHRVGYLLTGAGESILERIEEVDINLSDVERSLLGKDATLAGTIRLSTSDTLGYFWLPKFVKGFQQNYPDILIDIDISTQFRSLPRHEVDLVISASNQQPETMIGKCLGPVDFNIYASREYVKQHNCGILKLEQLSNQRILMPSKALSHLAVTTWLQTHVDESSIAMYCDKFTSLYFYCKQGVGLAPLPAHCAKEDDELLKIFNLPRTCASNIWMLTHPDNRQNARIRALMEYMKTHAISG